MDKRRFGIFINQLRKEKGITQKELAEILHVTDKAVSRWETGRSYPDVEVMQRIAECFDVSVNELLQGERIPVESIKTVTDKNVVNAFKRIKKNKNRYEATVAILAAVIVMLGCLWVPRIGAFMVTAPTVQERNYELGGTAKWVGVLDGEEYVYYIAYDDDYKIHEYSGPDGIGDESDYSADGHPDFSNYSDANKMAEDLEAYYNAHGGELQVEIRQLAPKIYKKEF